MCPLTFGLEFKCRTRMSGLAVPANLGTERSGPEAGPASFQTFPASTVRSVLGSPVAAGAQRSGPGWSPGPRPGPRPCSAEFSGKRAGGQGSSSRLVWEGKRRCRSAPQSCHARPAGIRGAQPGRRRLHQKEGRGLPQPDPREPSGREEGGGSAFSL